MSVPRHNVAGPTVRPHPSPTTDTAARRLPGELRWVVGLGTAAAIVRLVTLIVVGAIVSSFVRAPLTTSERLLAALDVGDNQTATSMTCAGATPGLPPNPFGRPGDMRLQLNATRWDGAAEIQRSSLGVRDLLKPTARVQGRISTYAVMGTEHVMRPIELHLERESMHWRVCSLEIG